MKIVGLSGSLDKASYNSSLLLAATLMLPEECQSEIIRPSLLASFPGFSSDWEMSPPLLLVDKVRNTISEADGLIIVTPEYNRSVPGWLKNIVDWCSRPREDAALKDKPTLVMGTSIGRSGARRAQKHLRKALKEAGAEPVGHRLTIPHADKVLDHQGRILDSHVRDQVQDGVNQLITGIKL